MGGGDRRGTVTPGPSSSDQGGARRTLGPEGRHPVRRNVWLWSTAVLAAALTLTASLALLPLDRTTRAGTSWFHLKMTPSGGTVPGQDEILGHGGEYCPPPASHDWGVVTGNVTFAFTWETLNGTRLPSFDVYVPDYLGRVPGSYVYSATNSSQGNFSQQGKGITGSLCYWALDFGATFSSYDSVVVTVWTSYNYWVTVPAL